MKTNSIISLSLIFFTSVLLAHEGCNHGEAPTLDTSSHGKYINLTHEEMHSANIKTATVKQKNLEEITSAIGRIENIPENVLSITSRIDGKVVEVYTSSDKPVKKGDSICKIESFLAGTPPPSDTLKTSINGIVENLNINNGSGVSQNTEVAKVVDNSKLYAVANVFETRVNKLEIGNIARIRIESLGDKIITGKLVKFGSVINKQNNTLPVYFEILNPDGKIKSGMRASFAIISSNEKQEIVVPNSAISEENGLKYVYIKTSPHSFERRIVHSDNSNDIETSIHHGVKIGDEVATKGLYQLRFMQRSDKQADDKNHTIQDNCTSTHSHQKKEEPEHTHTEHDECNNHGLYLENFVYCLLAISILLNFAFAIAYGLNRKNKTSGE